MSPVRSAARSTRRRLDALLGWLALGAVTWVVLSSLPVAWQHALPIFRYALTFASETPKAARLRVLGPRVASVYDRLRRDIPPDGAYLLLDGGKLQQGSPYWVRYQLAPRRAYLAGELGRLPSRAEILAAWRPEIRFAVVAPPEGEPPIVLEREELLRAPEPRDAGR